MRECVVMAQGRTSLSCLLCPLLRNWRESGEASCTLDACQCRVGFFSFRETHGRRLGVSHEAEKCSGDLIREVLENSGMHHPIVKEDREFFKMHFTLWQKRIYLKQHFLGSWSQKSQSSVWDKASNGYSGNGWLRSRAGRYPDFSGVSLGHLLQHCHLERRKKQKDCWENWFNWQTHRTVISSPSPDPW